MLASYLESKFGLHPIGRIFLVNLYEHATTDQIDVGTIIEIFQEMSATAYPFFDDDDALDSVSQMIGDFCNRAANKPIILSGQIKHNHIEFCRFARVVSAGVHNRYMSAGIRASRSGNRLTNSIIASEKRPSFFTQDLDLFRDHLGFGVRTPPSADEAAAILGLIHYWGSNENLLLYLLNSNKIAAEMIRPRTIEGRDNPAYLAVSNGEAFGMVLYELLAEQFPSYSSALPREFARALHLQTTVDNGSPEDGGIEFLVSISNREIVEALEEIVEIGVCSATMAQRDDFVSSVARMRCSDRKMTEVYDYFERAA